MELPKYIQNEIKQQNNKKISKLEIANIDDIFEI